VASLSVHRFDLALAYDVISMLFLVYYLKKKTKKKWGEFAGYFFSLGLSDSISIFT